MNHAERAEQRSRWDARHAAAAAALAPGGVLLVVSHDRSNLTEGVGGPQDPAVLFTPAEIAGGFPGLIVERAEVVRRPGTGEREPIDALLRAVRKASHSSR